jgi:hypothetical protein
MRYDQYYVLVFPLTTSIFCYSTPTASYLLWLPRYELAGHVTKIYLGATNLKGELSVSLKPLQELQWLNLACNSLTGLVNPDFLDWPR